jgi:GntR family transcriptional regulator
MDSADDVARYQRIAADLRRRIVSGEIPAGSRLPSERTLMEELGVARTTLREALRMLRDEGLVASEQGRGTFVRERSTLRRLARHRLTRAERTRTGGTFMADTATRGATPRIDVEILIEEADAPTALALDIDEGTSVLTRRRAMYADDQPVQLATSTFPADLVRGTQIERTDTGPGGVYARLEDLGHRLVRFDETVGARMPTADERAKLGVAAGVPVLTIVRVAYTADRPVEVNRIILNSDAYELTYELPAD